MTSMDAMNIDIFIVTYKKDHEWLKPSILTLVKNLTGYRRIVVVSQDGSDIEWLRGHSGYGCNVDPSRLTTIQAEPAPFMRGYHHQQYLKLHADLYTDAEYILHTDSDTFFKEPCDVSDFFIGGKPAWLWSYYNKLGDTVPWQQPTELAVDEPVDKEYMRTPTVIMHRSTHPMVREELDRIQGSMLNYFITAPKVSEYNIAGFLAHKHQPDLYEWVDRDLFVWPAGTHKVQQFWSKSNLEDHLPTIRAMLGESAEGLPIETTRMGWWVVSNDTHFKKWVIETDKLDHDEAFLSLILPHLKPGMTAVDIGANIGTHTHAYAKAVAGVDGGRVLAFEPNPLPFECLRRNMQGHGHVECFNVGLGACAGEMGMEMSNNVGASYMVPGTGFKVRTLDGYELTRCDYIKVDAEGFEMSILLGAARTIAQFRPVLVIEINVGALARNGVFPEDIFGWLRLRGYEINGYMPDTPQYDIICLPK